MKKTIIGAVIAASTLFTSVGMSFGDLLVPVMTYRVGPFAANGTMNANGFVDYLTMLNERDGGIGGVKIKVEECETGYRAEKGVECYESYRGKNPLVHTPNSTGITLQILAKAPEDKTPILTMGYGLSAAAKGETDRAGCRQPWVSVLGRSSSAFRGSQGFVLSLHHVIRS